MKTIRKPTPTPRAQHRAASAPFDSEVREDGARLGEVLVRRGTVPAATVAKAVERKRQGDTRKLGRLLVDEGALSESALTAALAEQSGLDVVDLRTQDPKPDATELMTDQAARQFGALPLELHGDTLVVALADGSEDRTASIAKFLGRPVEARIAPELDLLRAIDTTYRTIHTVGTQVREFEARDELRKDTARLDTAVANDDAPVVQVVHTMLVQALRDRASDVHVEPHGERIRVRYRIDGALHDVLDLPGSMGPGIASRIKILAGLNIVERRRPQDGQITTELDDRPVDIRVSTTAVVGGEKVVLRLLDKSRPLYRLAQLGMPSAMAESYARLLRSPYGMVICAGPTGSGKTTTLYGSLGEINSPDRNIMTIEDPVEYTYPSINQIQINEQAGITFASGLRSILRQDPDVILVGEVRDVETARIAVQSALTGHFVLSSLHATDAASALHRLVDMGIETFLVASSVTSVLSQRLVRRVCTYCAEAYQPSAEELAFVTEVGGARPDRYLHGVGCSFCAQTGYLDRIGVYEMLPITDGIRELVLDRAPHTDLRKLACAEGMTTLVEQGMQLVVDGITNPTEIMRAVYTAGA